MEPSINITRERLWLAVAVTSAVFGGWRGRCVVHVVHSPCPGPGRLACPRGPGAAKRRLWTHVGNVA